VNFQLHLTWRDRQQRLQHETFDLESVSEYQGFKFTLEDDFQLEHSRRLRLWLSLEQSVVIEECYLSSKIDVDNRSQMMVNGYQGWTNSREYDFREKQVDISKVIKPFAAANGDYRFIDYPNSRGKFHSWTYTYFRGKNLNSFMFLGSLEESFAFTSFHFDYDSSLLKIEKDLGPLELDNGEHLLFDLLIQNDDPQSAWDVYRQHYKSHHLQSGKRTGWLSWYHYYQDINQKVLEDNLNALAECGLPFEIFEIDDGYQSAVGDWLTMNKRKFPNGLVPLVEKIHSENMKAGLWLAPLVCTKQSQVFKKHKEWLLKDKHGKPVKAGHNPVWGSWIYVLDFYHPEVQDYLEQVFKTVLDEWGFDLLKLDFLYAACIAPGRRRTRGQVMNDVMSFLRKLVGNKELLACGVPLAAAFGKADLCRIGSDVTETWEHKTLKRFGVAERLSTYNSITSTLNRWQLGGHMFANDVDVFMLRDDQCRMAWHQKRTLLIVNYLMGQTFFSSDPFMFYKEKHWKLLKMAFPLLDPSIQKVIPGQENFYVVHFECKDKKYRAYVNLSQQKKRVWIEQGFTQSHGLLQGKRIIIQPYCTEVVLLEDQSIVDLKLVGADDHLIPGGCVLITGSQNEFQVQDTSMNSEVHLLLRYQGSFENILVNGNNYRVNNFSEQSLLSIQL
jgi:alpha-galactosidase